MILRELAPQLHIPWSMPFQLDDPPIVPTTFGKMMELRCVIGIIRHGDRTPKQKMKMEVKNHKFFQLFKKLGGYKDGNLKLKKPKQLQEILDIARELLAHKVSPGRVETEFQRGPSVQFAFTVRLFVLEKTCIYREIEVCFSILYTSCYPQTSRRWFVIRWVQHYTFQSQDKLIIL